MDIKDKIIKALLQALKPEYVRIEDDDGISGFVVSRKFDGMSTLDRQGKIDTVLQGAPLSQTERRHVLMIAGLTPEEYEAVGPRIRVHRVKEMANGVIEFLLHGGISDAQYLREILKTYLGVQTTEPKHVNGAPGVFMSFRANGTQANPLTREKAIEVLKSDRYIEVMPGT